MELLKVCFIYYLRITFEILDAIATEYVKLFDESNGIEVAKVTTAFYGCCT
jgi:F0F1-type ATP synthase delta subunit